jgi:hypothetical protein
MERMDRVVATAGEGVGLQPEIGYGSVPDSIRTYDDLLDLEAETYQGPGTLLRGERNRLYMAARK